MKNFTVAIWSLDIHRQQRPSADHLRKVPSCTAYRLSKYRSAAVAPNGRLEKPVVFDAVA